MNTDGIYRERYAFTPKALILVDSAGVKKVPWSAIVHCSTTHGCGKRVSLLSLADGGVATVQLHELATGWSGRISQLLHGMIERWGKAAGLGPSPLTVQEFAKRAQDSYAFAPNLEPHPSLQIVLSRLLALQSAPGVSGVYLLPDDTEESDLSVSKVIVVTSLENLELERFTASLGATTTAEASAATRRLVQVPDGVPAFEVIWD